MKKLQITYLILNIIYYVIFVIILVFLDIEEREPNYFYIKDIINGTYFTYINNIIFKDFMLNDNLEKNISLTNYFKYVQIQKLFDENKIEYFNLSLLYSNNLIFKLYHTYCLIKDINNNKTERIDDFKFCLETKIIKKDNIENKIDKTKYKNFTINNWKQNIYLINKTRYYLYQGINSEGVCDKTLGFKSCGFLTDIKVEFCIKINDLCPLLYKNNTIRSNLTLNSFVSNINVYFSAKNLIFPNIDYYDNIYRENNQLINNDKNDLNNLEIIDKYNLYDFFKDNKIMDSLYHNNNLNNLKNNDIFLVKNNKIKLETEEKIDNIYVQKNLFHLIYDESFLPYAFQFLIVLIFLYYLLLLFWPIAKENDFGYFEQYKFFYFINFIIILIYHLFLFLLFYLISIFLDLNKFKEHIIEGNYIGKMKLLNYEKLLLTIFPHILLLNISIYFLINIYKQKKIKYYKKKNNFKNLTSEQSITI